MKLDAHALLHFFWDTNDEVSQWCFSLVSGRGRSIGTGNLLMGTSLATDSIKMAIVGVIASLQHSITVHYGIYCSKMCSIERKLCGNKVRSQLINIYIT